MKLIIFFIFLPFVSSDFHSLFTTYTGIRGATTPGTPEFSAVTTLDYEQIDYYDSIDEKLIPRQDWMREYESQDQWTEDTEIRKKVQWIYSNNIAALMDRFNQTGGVHVYQRVYGCEWDDQTGESYGFDRYGYDGEDFIMLDLMNSRYIASVQQGEITTTKWNQNGAQLESLQHYHSNECIEWMRNFLKSMKHETKAPQVSLLQKSPSSPVLCHATGFYPTGITITWMKNEEEHHEDVDFEELLPNEDGTFQKTSVLNVPQDEWKRDEYVCVVEHMGKALQKILTEDEIRSNSRTRGLSNWLQDVHLSTPSSSNPSLVGNLYPYYCVFTLFSIVAF